MDIQTIDKVFNFFISGVASKTISFIYRVLAVLFGAFMLTAQAAPLQLSPQELSWIKAHPKVYYTVKERWPQEYREGKKHIGLSRTLLDNIEQRTGQKFIYVSPDNALEQRPMMVSALSHNRMTEEERSRWLWTFPWANVMPMIAGRNDSTRLRTLSQLVGKWVAIAEVSDYEPWLRQNYPGINLVFKKDVLSALKSVDEGETDAVIASGLVLLPIMQRNYFNRLAISAQIPEMLSSIRMAVDPDYPELQTILNESMANISALGAQKIYTLWISHADFGMPTWGYLVYHYRYSLLIACTLVVLLLWSLRRAIVSRKQAQHSEKYKTDFLNIMSHEIRTPINAIIAALELLRQSKQSEKRQQYVELAVSSSMGLLELLNGVLDHTKMTKHQLALARAPCELQTLVESICDSQQAAARRKGLTLSLQFDAHLAGRWFKLDPHRIRQIINNLLSNAIKFTLRGEVALSVHAEEVNGKLSVLSFSVRDTGIGINTEIQGKLFQAWEQSTENHALQASGSGLGLYICRSLTTLMQGTITLHSEPGIGTVIDVAIPVEECAAQQAKETVEMLLPNFLGLISVLLVEDHQANRQLLGDQLALMSCHYETAEDGETALQLLQEENYYDIILLDCGLPGIDGYQTAQMIRELEQRSQRDATPIVAISALNSESHLARCRASGINDVLTKPIRLNQLAKRLKRWSDAAYEVSLTQPVSNKPTMQELSNGLSEDVQQFQQAMVNGDLRGMIYYVHRITGVAQMYDLQELAAFSSQLEQTLRADPPPTEWCHQQWLEQLNNLLISLPR
jgi:two-component system sensor histidine kinase EvgS